MGDVADVVLDELAVAPAHEPDLPHGHVLARGRDAELVAGVVGVRAVAASGGAVVARRPLPAGSDADADAARPGLRDGTADAGRMGPGLIGHIETGDDIERRRAQEVPRRPDRDVSRPGGQDPVNGEHLADALVYGSEDELLTVGAPFLQAGLDAGDVTLLVCAADRNAVLAEAVGDHPGLTVLAPPQVWRRPCEAIDDYRRLLETAVLAGRRVRILADSDFGPGPVDWSEWARFEAVAHHVNRRDPVWSICLLDRRDAPAEVIAATERLHPTRYHRGVRTHSRAYQDPADNVRRAAYVPDDPMTALRPTLRVGNLATTDLTELRHAVAAELHRVDLPRWRAYEFTVAVSETAGNAVQHGRPPVTVLLWCTPRRVLCTVTDSGVGFDYPLSGYLSADPGRPGMGLYLTRQLTDQVNVCWTPEGFTVRLALVLS